MTLNYNIHFEERCGRMLVAARDIAAGEIIFQVKDIILLLMVMVIMTYFRTNLQPWVQTITQARSV